MWKYITANFTNVIVEQIHCLPNIKILNVVRTNTFFFKFVVELLTFHIRSFEK